MDIEREEIKRFEVPGLVKWLYYATYYIANEITQDANSWSDSDSHAITKDLTLMSAPMSAMLSALRLVRFSSTKASFPCPNVVDTDKLIFCESVDRIGRISELGI